ncbi:mitochondrial import inner membrane translocase subunit TIM50-A [Drosophila grimshawi]|uniref:mitochondrial import inner membrane translocase subunit TIM50-A n=1 Tax=Drosophila grimshawi TaxID=7222 RepID=UPI000C86FDEB|nr:mitochondrial import inner membrane translocase subunit TIM50-A [Drosophila grimshawi]
MYSCSAWLRVIQQQVGMRSSYPWSSQRIIQFKYSSSDIGNKRETPSKNKASRDKIDSKCRKDDFKAVPKYTYEITRRPNQSQKPSKPSKPSPIKFRSKWRYGYSVFLAGLCSMLWAVYELGKPEHDQRGRSIEDELSSLPLLQQYVQRMWHSLHYYQKMLEEPVPTKLVPDIQQPPYVQPRYTLVLEMRDVLVHPDWTYQTGWRFKKRPGVDHFLRECSKHFEIIVYTAEQGTTAFPILDALDPNGYIRYRLVRGATQLLDGKHIKNLNRLNRNLRRVIVVDWDCQAVPLHPDNIFAIARWVGNDDDVQLFDLAAFLKLIAEHKMEDVREVLHYYHQFEDPIEQFKENQRKLLEMKQEKPDAETGCLK